MWNSGSKCADSAIIKSRTQIAIGYSLTGNRFRPSKRSAAEGGAANFLAADDAACQPAAAEDTAIHLAADNGAAHHPAADNEAAHHDHSAAEKEAAHLPVA